MKSEATYLPISLRLDDARALVVGGGQVASNKLRLLLGRCPDIAVLGPVHDPEIVSAIEAGQVTHLGDAIVPDALAPLLEKMRIVFAATDDAALNREIAALGRKMRVNLCVVDDPAPSTFITPAIIDRTPVQIAISTDGAAPVLARRLRTRIEALLPDGISRLARFMRAQREWIREVQPDTTARRRAWEAFVDGAGAEQALRGDEPAARASLEKALAGVPVSGEVWLVGAGPGDPDLLTLAALRLMQNADSVLYDQLIPPAIMDRVRRDAERVFVGKRKNHHTLPQDRINEELVRRARQGERVLRLKGGDPFIFGRGGEEMEALVEAGVTVRVIPGITAASGCGAAAGIPLTHRDCAQTCVFVTGHARADGTLALDWPSLARKGQTLAIYMGLAPLADLCAQLQAHGLPGNWPAAIVEHGTRHDQRVHVATLATLPALVKERRVVSPALTLVGEVVEHRREIHRDNL
ncbi:siroheme synthase CysG [Swaminathania salitolerans]|uniref:Siroheme synthase n=1 Tax=Swaminathania salitolerans TaxID=182838 RepID=A0A511BLE7_9PROT|nr:siroheme synthase CysG [Swaminathania salitolerans]GBQ10112.1 siroheme synthase [Swaminathania salitolerans LMG 21291]GEL01170.1 siroheme synthase [Swaminathania salitolerans]